MLTLVKRNMTPPIGWRYPIPESDHLIVQGDFNSLIFAVGRWYALNDHDVPEDLPAIIEDWICKQLPDSLVKGGVSHEIRDRRYVTYATVRKAVTYILEDVWKRTGRKLVTQEVAEERAAGCLDCEFNMPSAACSSCKGLDGYVRGYIGRRTALDEHLSVCQVTLVMNMAHIHLTEDTLRPHTPGHLIPEHPEECWKRKLLEKDHG